MLPNLYSLEMFSDANWTCLLNIKKQSSEGQVLVITHYITAEASGEWYLSFDGGAFSSSAVEAVPFGPNTSVVGNWFLWL